MAPGIRLGWICGQPDLIEVVASARTDFGVSQWMCRAMSHFMSEGHLEPHIERANTAYRRKRDIATTALRRYCGDWLGFTPPVGGMYFWLRMREGVDWERAQRAAALAGVQMRHGEKFGAEGASFLRLAFCHATPEELEQGIEALGAAISNAVTRA